MSIVYLKAAKRIEAGKNQFSCAAISKLSNTSENEKKYREIFSATEDKFETTYGVKDWWNGAYTPENQFARSLALLFMYEISKDEPNGYCIPESL